MNLDLSGQVALVPGGSGGIGGAVAAALAEAGADIAITCRRNRARAEAVADRARALGRRAIVSAVDMTDRPAVAQWVAESVAELGRVDILANCVGYDGTFQLFAELPPEEWQAMVGQQFWAPVNACYAVLGHMVARRSGRIISLGSDGAKVGQSGMALGNAANAGVMGFSKSLARELARHAITVNVVCAGPTEGPTLDALRSSGDTGAKLVDAAIRTIPMKRPGAAAELAAAFVFLASSQGGYITGQAISVSGGLTMS
jgi:2-hydroxycyclohexanecarboxyl-CoA dehydrogenase